jgi:membrane protein YqaA with SNARE-associated domain
MLTLTVALLLGLVGSALGGSVGFVVGFVAPLLYMWQMRRLRDRRRRGIF